MRATTMVTVLKEERNLQSSQKYSIFEFL